MNKTKTTRKVQTLLASVDHRSRARSYATQLYSFYSCKLLHIVAGILHCVFYVSFLACETEIEAVCPSKNYGVKIRDACRAPKTGP